MVRAGGKIKFPRYHHDCPTRETAERKKEKNEENGVRQECRHGFTRWSQHPDSTQVVKHACWPPYSGEQRSTAGGDRHGTGRTTGRGKSASKWRAKRILWVEILTKKGYLGGWIRGKSGFTGTDSNGPVVGPRLSSKLRKGSKGVFWQSSESFNRRSRRGDAKNKVRDGVNVYCFGKGYMAW